MDRAARDARRRRVVGPAGRPLQADDRRLPLLGAAGHDPAAAVAGQGAVHRRATRGPSATSRSTSRCSPASCVALALPSVSRRSSTARPATPARRPIVAVRADRPARRARPARQGRVPRRPQRAVPAGADLLRRSPVRRHDRRREAADRGRVGRRRRSRSSAEHFAQRDPADGQQHAVAASKAIKRLHYRDFPNDLRPSTRAVSLAHVGGTIVEIVPAARPAVLAPTAPSRCSPSSAWSSSTCSSSRRSRWPCRWSGTCCSCTSPRSCSSATRHGTASASATSHPAAAGRDRRRAAVLPGARQPAPRPRLVPALDAPVRRQLGDGHVGVRARAPRPSSTATSSRAPATQIDQLGR